MQKSRVQRIWENAVVFYLGGMFYCTVELLWRQWTHGSMFLLGGLCFWTVSSLGRCVRMPLLAQMALGACIVTFFEFWTGVLVNRVMHLGVWDYSAAPFNLLGQICLPFTLLWFPLCGIGILLDRGMRRALFGTRPRSCGGCRRPKKCPPRPVDCDGRFANKCFCVFSA